MKNPLLKKILPHAVAVLIFLVVSAIFCKPALEGNVLNQHDIVSWKGMAQNAFEYKEKNGRLPLWNPNLFSGMPNYQVTMEGKSVLPPITNALLFTLPNPINFFFWACVCFYILCLAFRLKPVVAIFGGLAYAFVTYNPVILSAGHESKMWAIAFMPLVMAGIICIFEKKYWMGLALTSFGAYLQIGVNHPQISYYFFIVAVAVTISYLVTWIKNREWKHIAIAAGVTAIAGIAGVAGNALSLLTTSEYTRYTMRGGKDVTIEGDKVTLTKTSGLDTGYAFEYSLGKTETAVLLMPNAFGGSSAKTLPEDSKVVNKLVNRGVPENNAQQIAASLPAYWGGIDGSAGTAGPPYAGALVCLLALLGFVLLKTPLRWGLLAATILGVMMAWGKYLPGFNNFLFNNLPLYNKFRAPSMAMVITQLTLPLMAVLSLNYMLFRENSREALKKDFKKIMYTAGGLIALLGLLYLGMNYSSPIDKLILGNKWDNSGTDEIGRLIISGMKQDRKDMFGGQLLRTAGFLILLLGVLYMFTRNWIKPAIAAVILLMISSIDLLVIGKQYLNEDNYVSKDEMTAANFVPTAIDQEILKDTDPNYRVFYLSGDAFSESRTTYFHKSVGGYHPAKLRIYQDVIERYLSAQHPGSLNMLNAKYFIARDPQTGQPAYMKNDKAYGNCWLVKQVKLVDGRAAALQALDSANLRDTAIVESSLSKYVIQPQWDSASFIRMTKFDNDAIEYEANCNGPQFAVFSEVYYPAGWNAYLDGKKTEYVNTNYILRGLSVPAGKHTIRFVFEPASYKKGSSISFIASILILLFFAGGLFMAWKESKKQAAVTG